MNKKSILYFTLVCLGSACLLPGTALASSHAQSSETALSQKMSTMQQQITALQKQLDKLRQEQATQQKSAKAQQQASQANSRKIRNLAKKKVAKKSTNGIKIGGAVRFQYAYEDYSPANEHRNGDLDFDIFRLNFRGKVDNIELQAEWRWFQYMSAIKYAWIGYDFNKTSKVKLGLTRIPFGNQPYDSHSYFFSSNYYLGLEDTYHAGIQYVYTGDPWNVQLAFFKNDAQFASYGGEAYNSYSYNVLGVGLAKNSSGNPANPARSVNTYAGRVAYDLKPIQNLKVELGLSGLRGDIDNGSHSLGYYYAYAVNMNAFYKRWNVQAQVTRYQYNVHGPSGKAKLLTVGAYAFYDGIAAKANTYTFNVRYHLPVHWGPVKGLDFYNDYSLVTDKSNDLPNTYMDDLGIAVAAGDLYTYFDFVTARNQPFIGGSMIGNGKVDHRFNVNFGFYF